MSAAPDLSALEAAIFARQGHRQGAEVRFLCPGHDDRHPSARWHMEKHTWYCDPCGLGGGWRDLAERLGLDVRERRNGRGGGGSLPSRSAFEHSNGSHAGLTLAQYAKAKRLPPERLRAWGLSDVFYDGRPAVRMVYRDAAGNEAAVRFRLTLEKTDDGDDRFRWKSGAKPCLYGLDRLERARAAGYAVLNEGESDTHTHWLHDIPGLGIPGASNWREDRDAPHLADIPILYVVREPDQGGQAVDRWLARSSIRERVRLVDLGEYKDASGLYLADPERFLERWQAALDAAVPWTVREQAHREDAGAEAYAMASGLLHDPLLLDRVGEAMHARGYAGDLRPPKLGYVATTSRWLERPQNLAYVAQSAAGKNRAVDAALDLIPPEAVYTEKAGSARALIYSDEDFRHRVVVVAEADSIPEDGPAASAIRSLAADNEMAYDVVEKNPRTNRFETRHIRKPGPTGLITTSTRSLGSQMGTRMLEVPLSDDAGQTRAVMKAHARGVVPSSAEPPDSAPLVAMQRWLELAGERRVAVPFAEALADLVPSTAVRMRRDFRQLLTSIQAIALLYQCQRRRTPEGWVEATIDDYTHARELLAPIFDTLASEGVTPAIRQTVEAIEPGEELAEGALAERLRLSKSTMSWRVRRAVKAGWLVNNETRRGHPARLSKGAPLPEATSALPEPTMLSEVFECSNHNRDGRDTPSPPSDEEVVTWTA